VRKEEPSREEDLQTHYRGNTNHNHKYNHNHNHNNICLSTGE